MTKRKSNYNLSDLLYKYGEYLQSIEVELDTFPLEDANRAAEEYITFLESLRGDSSLIFEFLMIHVYCELEMNRLINQVAVHPKEMVKKMYKPKLDFLWYIGVLPDWLRHNLKVLNLIRNQYAHNSKPRLENVQESMLKGSGNEHVDLNKIEYDCNLMSLIYALTLKPLKSINLNDGSKET